MNLENMQKINLENVQLRYFENAPAPIITHVGGKSPLAQNPVGILERNCYR